MYRDVSPGQQQHGVGVRWGCCRGCRCKPDRRSSAIGSPFILPSSRLNFPPPWKRVCVCERA